MLFGSTLTRTIPYFPDLLLPIVIGGFGIGIISVVLPLCALANVGPREIGPISALTLMAQSLGGPLVLVVIQAVQISRTLYLGGTTGPVADMTPPSSTPSTPGTPIRCCGLRRSPSWSVPAPCSSATRPSRSPRPSTPARPWRRENSDGVHRDPQGRLGHHDEPGPAAGRGGGGGRRLREIVAVGSVDQCRTAAPDARWEDLGTQVLMPGFIQAHDHPVPAAVLCQQPAHWIALFVGFPTWADVEALFAELRAQTPAGQPLLFNGLDRLLLSIPMPDRASLDRYFPDHPVLIFDITGHALYFHPRATVLFGWSDATPPPDTPDARWTRRPDGTAAGSGSRPRRP